jgi:hypothetical protein
MEGSCSTGESPQWTVVPVEEEEEEEGYICKILYTILKILFTLMELRNELCSYCP